MTILLCQFFVVVLLMYYYLHGQDAVVEAFVVVVSTAYPTTKYRQVSNLFRNRNKSLYSRLQVSSDEDYYNSESRSDSGQPSSSRNEFSRVVWTDRIFARRKAHAPEQQREYQMSIRANPTECQALADRFELTNLTQLEATVSIRPAICAQSFGGRSNVVVPVEVEGMIVSHVTQTCVRTNERFEVDVEVPIHVLVKPMTIEAMLQGGITEDYHQEDEPSSNKKKKISKKRNKASFSQSSQNVHSLDDVYDLQTAIEASEAASASPDPLFRDDVKTASSLIEDEAIYSSTTSILDVGELVAQTFWLQLDPFPKKLGTGPIEMEISG